MEWSEPVAGAWVPVVLLLLTVGLGFSVYWLARAIVFISKGIGLGKETGATPS